MPSDTPPKNLIENMQPDIDMPAFRKEIAALVQKRQNATDDELLFLEMTQLKNIESVEELDEWDALMWRKANNYEREPITEILLRIYKGKVDNSGSSSRKEFMAVIIERVTPFWVKEQLKEYKPKKKK